MIARALDAAALVGVAFLLSAVTLRALTFAQQPGAWLPLASAAVVAYVAADLVSGTVHWLCDTFFEEDTPIVGRAVIEPFREHHRDPLAMTRRGFLSVNGSNWMAMIPVLALAGWGEASLRHAFLFFFGLAVCLTNQFHMWAHAERVPRVVSWLQRARVIVPPSHHARHHRSRQTQAFCVTSGWCNPLLDRLGVFARIERRVRST